MELTKNLLQFAVLSFAALAVNGCVRLKCYKCNSQDSPNTCGEANFDAGAHSGDTTIGSTSTSGGTSCIRGWAINDQGTYYYRDKSNQFMNDGCETPQKCVCNDNLCNSKASRVVTMTTVATTIICSSLGIVLVKKILI
ncbi:uncharacterized protein LOC123560383 isoform X3 [Mercenaria mercenaria]|uniref:uncharacterized protein LOC123560383 isoform X3 n=1 Tax=Mercenaria mercenaria TaxID=6596 RepID=UPI00234E7D50|nr:uncharacterized protein LOC123560383 isoform X3 [Mercenaria mercenaria]